AGDEGLRRTHAERRPVDYVVAVSPRPQRDGGAAQRQVTPEDARDAHRLRLPGRFAPDAPTVTPRPPVASRVTMPLDLDELVAPAHTALVLQEVQNGVVGEESALPMLATEAKKVGVVDNCAELARAARGAGVPVVHCTAETRADRKGANRNARLFMGVQK